MVLQTYKTKKVYIRQQGLYILFSWNIFSAFLLPLQAS